MSFRMNSLKIKKKIIILGANFETIPLVKTALSMGCDVYVADPYPYSPAKLIEGVEGVDIDGNDIEKLAKYCLSNNIKSVALGVADRLVLSYFYLCKKLGAYCLANENTINILSNKIKFNSFCKDNNLSVIPNLNYEDLPRFFSDGGKLLIKPVDSNSSKGIQICDNIKNIKKLVKISKSHSKSNKVFLEEFMYGGGVGIYLTFSKGKCLNYTIYDRVTSEGSIGPNNLPVAGLYPSRYQNLYIKSVHSKLVKALIKQGLSDGILMLSAFIKNSKFHFYDPGFRLQGEGADVIVKYNTGIDQLKNLITYALTGTNKHEFNIKKNSYNYLASIWIYLKPGKIIYMNGIKEISQIQNVILIRQRLNIGDKVEENTINTESSVAVRFYVGYKNIIEFKNIIKLIKKLLKIKNKLGENMIRNSYSKIFKDL